MISRFLCRKNSLKFGKSGFNVIKTFVGKSMMSLNLSISIDQVIQNKENTLPMETLSQYFEVALAIHAACSAICALTPTPADDKLVGKAYKIIEILGLVIGRAKMR